MFYLRFVLAVVALSPALLLLSCSSDKVEEMQAPLNDVSRWGVQLQDIEIKKIHRSDLDLVVIDYSKDGTAQGRFSSYEIAKAKEKPDGSRRRVLAYLSIGEAEDYRDYWKDAWQENPPEWLGDENPNWPGNYTVKFWQSEWQGLIMAYLKHIISAGYDGVYLDGVDVFQRYDERDLAQARMAKFVGKVSRLAKAQEPGFIIVAQNGEELLRFPEYRDEIDGISKEDLLYGAYKDGARNSPQLIDWSWGFLAEARRDGLSVFVIEYLEDGGKRKRAREELDELGVISLFTRRPLDTLVAF
ncbi:MJ1477/TM1410 family putative glycoside hydrolase [Pseudovibrio ascidiaceicola]|uniref:MJ1477/TM1410 family putative glycoside hydrolase n=1 Tax=Pseudovibrio ascidiaceicola TaxID=285279 RepID=UPI003D3669B6